MKEPWKTKVLEIIQKYPKRFFLSGYLPPVKDVEYSFRYIGKPFRHDAIVMPYEDRKYVMDAMREQEKFGVVKEVKEDVHKLQYVSATFLKAEIGKARICINYTDMNDGTERVDFPLPNKEDLIAKFAGGDYYISMDAKAAYNQVPVAKECKKYMVFVVLDEDNNKRYYAPLRANFGSMNMPGFFHRLENGEKRLIECIPYGKQVEMLRIHDALQDLEQAVSSKQKARLIVQCDTVLAYCRAKLKALRKGNKTQSISRASPLCVLG